jgi:hypothetical protein
MIPSNLYSQLSPEQKHIHQLQMRHELERLRQWHPQAALKASRLATDTFSRNPELDVPRAILEGSIAVAISHNKIEAWLSPNEIDHLTEWLKHVGAQIN